MVKDNVVGFIGTGVMGQGMIKNLLKAGFDVNIFTRTKVKATQLMTEGANWVSQAKELAETSDIIITMIGTPKDVRDIYFGSGGLIENARESSYLIDMTTSQPNLAIEIYQQAKLKGLHALDAPVSGGDVGAQNGLLAIMVGGDQSSFDAVLPVFKAMGENIRLQGEAGAGQHTKLMNQIAIAPGMIGVAEALIYAEKAGLTTQSALKSIETGAAGSWSLSNYAPRMIQNEFEPGFAIKHFIKDMEIAVESSKELGLNTPGLELALSMYKELQARGLAEKGIHAITHYYN